MNIAAGTKETNSLEESEGNSSLRLVARTEKGSPNRTFRIGVSDDVFARVEHSRQKPLDSIKRNVDDGFEEVLKDESGAINTSRRVESVIALAAVGLVLGYLLGRHSRE